MNISL